MPNQSKKYTRITIKLSGDQLSTLRTLIHPTAFKQELPRIIDRGMRTKPENPVDTDFSTVYQRYQDEETARLLGELNLLDHPGHDRGHGLPAAAAPLLALRRCQFGRHDDVRRTAACTRSRNPSSPRRVAPGDERRCPRAPSNAPLGRPTSPASADSSGKTSVPWVS